MMRKDRDLFCISAEIIGVSMIIAGLGNQLDNNETDTLTPSAMRSALHGVQVHLERIADDLDHIEGKGEKKGAGK